MVHHCKISGLYESFSVIFTRLLKLLNFSSFTKDYILYPEFLNIFSTFRV